MTEGAMLEGARRTWRPKIQDAVFILGFALLAIPTLIENYQQNWSTEQGQASPIVLLLGLWLVWRRWPSITSSTDVGRGSVCIAGGLGRLLVYLFGRGADQFLIESYALFFVGVLYVYTLYGLVGLKRAWFPFFYLIFALPVPYTVTMAMTTHLRLWITEAVVNLCSHFGFNIVRDGLNILIDQYEIAVQDACSGMNSLFSLSAIGLIYVNLRRSPSWRYYLIMAIPIVAFAIMGNFARVMFIVCLTHFFGDAVAQGVLHETAGLVTFMVGLLGVVAVDHLAQLVLTRRHIEMRAA